MFIKIISLFLINGVTGTISGLNYMEPIIQREHKNYLPGQDPCNPLYWYPRQVPDYCNFKIPPPPPNIQPAPVPIPVPMPMPPPPPPPMYPVPMPFPGPPPMRYPGRPPMPYPGPPLMPFPGPPPVPFPRQMAMPPPSPPMMPLIPQPFAPAPVPLPYGLPLAPSGPMIPVPGMQRYPPFLNYGPFGQAAGMMPGIEGLVTKDGGINVLPFSDVYADVIERHKTKMVRKKLKKLMKDYEKRFQY